MKHSLKDIFINRPKKEMENDLYKVRKLPYHKDDMRLLEKMLKSSSGRKKTYVKTSALSGTGGFGGSSFENTKNQRVMFKMSYSKNIKVHEKYLNTYMPQENKSHVTEKPILFGTPENEYMENMSDLHFKCIISPENQEVNLELLCNEFIKRMEVLTGYKLYWRGCIHNDTEHRHAHLCINGKDKNGKNIRFPKEMIKTTMRETLSYVTTLMVGERSDKEIEAARRNMNFSKRWTKLDESLESYGKKISLHNLPSELTSRLAFLSEIGLSQKYEKYYTLCDDWKDVLVSSGRYNTFLEQWQEAKGNLELYAGGKVSGICEKVITFDKDESWNDAVIIKDGDKRIYVPIWQLNKENLIGKKIEIAGGTRSLSRQIKSSDIHVIDDMKKQNKSRRKNLNN